MRDNKHSAMAFDRSEFTEIKADNTEKLRQAKNLKMGLPPNSVKSSGKFKKKKNVKSFVKNDL